jgi:acetyl-CoA C-acetyltransferase
MKTIYVVDGARTPFLKARSGPGPFPASDLATQAGRSLLLRQPFSPEDLDEVILGCAAPSPDETNIGRMVALRLGCGNKVPGWTVMRNCASGMQALDSAIANIQCGRSSLVLAGGVDALSHAPLLYSEAMVRWFAGMMAMKSAGQKAGHFVKLRPGALLSPVIGLMKGLTDPVCGLLMGQTAENLAWKFGIDRQQMDAFAVRSHQRVMAGRAAGHYGEIVPLVDDKGNIYGEDDGVRRRCQHGRHGQAEAVLRQEVWQHHRRQQLADHRRRRLADPGCGRGGQEMEPQAARPHRRQRVGRPRSGADGAWPGACGDADPAAHGLGLNDLDAWELNEAFAAQVLGCLAAWKSDDYCREQLGLPGALGALDEHRLNVDGGAIAVGHPVGASGARIVLHLLHVLREKQAKRGMATICIGGGLGGAMLVEAEN